MDVCKCHCGCKRLGAEVKGLNGKIFRPVTIHYNDKTAYLALRGIKPKTLEGNIPFWL